MPDFAEKLLHVLQAFLRGIDGAANLRRRLALRREGPQGGDQIVKLDNRTQRANARTRPAASVIQPSAGPAMTMSLVSG